MYKTEPPPLRIEWPNPDDRDEIVEVRALERRRRSALLIQESEVSEIVEGGHNFQVFWFHSQWGGYWATIQRLS